MYLGHDFGQLSDASPIDDSNDNDGGGGTASATLCRNKKENSKFV